MMYRLRSSVGAVLGVLAVGLVLSVVACAEREPETLQYPADLGVMAIPDDNAQSDAKIALGHQLFFDARLSADGSRSCYSCHMNEHGNGGGEPTAIGALDRALPRHSPVIWNVGYMNRWYWDGRAGSLEDQATGAWAGGNMGVGRAGLDAKASEVAAVASYADQFAAVFPSEGVTPATIVKAIAAYERTLVCDDTRYDRFARGDREAISRQERDGLELFMGRAGCAACHTPPFFSSQFAVEGGTYFNTGIGIEGEPDDEVDVGRMGVTEAESDWAAFKTPSLRNVSKSGPYFHDGSIVSLEDAVRFMAGGGYPNRNLSPLLIDRGLSDAEAAALVAFLGSLECGTMEVPELP